MTRCRGGGGRHVHEDHGNGNQWRYCILSVLDGACLLKHASCMLWLSLCPGGGSNQPIQPIHPTFMRERVLRPLFFHWIRRWVTFTGGLEVTSPPLSEVRSRSELA